MMHPNIVPNENNWRENARCAGVDSNLFFPERGESRAAAYLICNDCVTQVPCLEYALASHEPGIYAATSDKERKLIRKTGLTAIQYVEGRQNGTITAPKRGRPISSSK